MRCAEPRPPDHGAPHRPAAATTGRRPRGIIRPMATVVLRDPSLVVLIGAAGSGKSTLAARAFAPDEIVSSDALRAVVSGDEADQSATRVAFKILHHTVARRLAARRLTVVDATNASVSDRRPLVSRARAAGIPVTAIVLDLEPGTVHVQNAGRPRVVTPHVDRSPPRCRPKDRRRRSAGARGIRPDRRAAHAGRGGRPVDRAAEGLGCPAEPDQRDRRTGQTDADRVVAGDGFA